MSQCVEDLCKCVVTDSSFVFENCIVRLLRVFLLRMVIMATQRRSYMGSVTLRSLRMLTVVGTNLRSQHPYVTEAAFPLPQDQVFDSASRRDSKT